MKHKHYDVLIAIAEGKEVQWFCVDDKKDPWTDMGKHDLVNPLWYPQFEWRVKPETKPDVVKWMGVNDINRSSGFVFLADDKPSIEWLNRIKFTFDGNDPTIVKSVELVK